MTDAPMTCPSCDASTLVSRALEADLVAHACSKCDGHWLGHEDYRRWLEGRKPADPERTSPTLVTTVADQHAKLCPNCRRIMLRYRVGHGADLSIDVCGGCSGFWFDHNEWLALKANGLHDDLHLVATEPWQAEVRRDEARRHLDALYRRRYGPDYEEILRLRRWLTAHPQRDSILAFLSDPDPFEP